MIGRARDPIGENTRLRTNCEGKTGREEKGTQREGGYGSM